MKKLSLLCLLIVVLGSCQSKRSVASDKSTVATNFSQHSKNEFEIQEGVGLMLTDANLKIRFLGVTQDSRCPKNVQCIWAGNARIALDVNGTGFTLDTQNMQSNNYVKSRNYGGYTYTLQGLSPEKDENAKKVKYSILLKIEKTNKPDTLDATK